VSVLVSCALLYARLVIVWRCTAFSVLAGLSLACSRGSTAAPAPAEAGFDASPRDATVTTTEAASDAHRADDSGDSRAPVQSGLDAGADVATPTTALVRLANWSPDAPGVDFCLAPHESSVWRGPVLSAALGAGLLGNLTIVDEQTDSGARDARADAADDGSTADGGSSESSVDDKDARAPAAGITFPRISPYVSVAPGKYDVRVVAAGATDCATPIFDERTDLPAFVAGAFTTLAAVGDLNAQGTDPAIALAAFSDDSSVPAGEMHLRFVNAIPSVTAATLVVLGIHFTPVVSAAPFGTVGVDTDAGPLDSNDYVTLAPPQDATWFIINANVNNAVLAGVYAVSIPNGNIATAVAIGGESGGSAANIGVLVCVDRPPIVAGEAARCTLLEGPGLAGPVCPSCSGG